MTLVELVDTKGLLKIKLGSVVRRSATANAKVICERTLSERLKITWVARSGDRAQQNGKLFLDNY